MIKQLHQHIPLLLLLAFSVSAADAATVSISEQEQQWLDSVDTIRMCTDPDWMPYEGIDREGKQKGIMSDFHALWAEKIGKPVELVPTKTWQQSLEFLKNKRCDLLSSAQDTPARRRFMSVTAPFIFYPYAVATQPDHQFIINLTPVDDETFAVIRGYSVVEVLHQFYPEIHLKLVDDARTGLRMVEKGQVFGFIDTVPSINYQALKYGISHIKVSGVLDHKYEMSVGVRKDLPQLLSLYNKAIAATTSKERQQILDNWLSLKVDYQFDYALMWKVLAGVVLLLACFGYHYFMVRRHNRQLVTMNRQLEHLSHSDQLTGMHNRYYLHQAFDRELRRYQRYQREFAIIILDIDLFKRVNDEHGHVQGDRVIQQMANLLVSNIRDNDVVGRWGGEEFMILCPETDAIGARALAEHLRSLISQTDFGIDNMTLTASFGITEYRGEKVIEDCIKRADQALYRAKHSGRNKSIVF
jgi:polar amino acid transport system substrate-binding protein